MHYLERWFGPAILVAFVFVVGQGIFTQLNHGTELHGAGASFPAPLYTRWIALYERGNPQVEITYESIGSGGGIDAITEQEVHFGASDALMSESELEQAPGEILQIPMAMGPVVMAYNLPRLDERITLNADVIVDIYRGEIESWTDERIAELNPELDLPDMPIHVTHRSDSSGTTAIFTEYLSAVSETWRDTVGQGKVINWPITDGAGDGNDGVAQQILLRPGGIGYVEFTYAENAGLEYAAIINREGEAVLPSVESVQAAERNTPAAPGERNKPSIVNAPGEDSYPIAGFTYLLVYQDLSYFEHAEEAEALLQYLEWALTEGQRVAPDLNYTPIPEPVQQAALELVESIEVPEHDETDEQQASTE